MQWLTKNWPIKGAALFLALMLYVAVQLQQPVTTSFDVTLNIQMPRGRALVQKPPKVRVQISGKGSQILKLRSLAGDITPRVPDSLTTSTYSRNGSSGLRMGVNSKPAPSVAGVHRSMMAP